VVASATIANGASLSDAAAASASSVVTINVSERFAVVRSRADATQECDHASNR